MSAESPSETVAMRRAGPRPLSDGTTFVGSDDAGGLQFAIVVSRYNEEITGRLLESCQRVLMEKGVARVDVAWVPGALELPLAARCLAVTRRYDAIIALGCIIKGETLHFELVARETTAGLSRVALDSGVPVINEVLAVFTPAQAQERAGGRIDRGKEAAQAAIQMATLLRRLP